MPYIIQFFKYEHIGKFQKQRVWIELIISRRSGKRISIKFYWKHLDVPEHKNNFV